VKLSWLKNVYSHPTFCRDGILTNKVNHTKLLLVCNQGSLVGLCMQEYKSLCAVVIICGTMVNIQIDRHTDSILISLYE